MTDASPTAPAAKDNIARHRQIEMTGIEVIAESERTAKPHDLFWPWFAANISVFGISYAAWIYGFEVSFWQGLIVAILGITLSFLLCGVIALAGKRGNAPTMILSRAAYGYTGNKVPGVISWLVSVGWETFLAILAVLATVTVFERLHWGAGVLTKVLAALAVAGLIVLASVIGYHLIMKLQSVLTWITGAMTATYIAMTIHTVDFSQVQQLPAGPWQAMMGALVLMMTGFGLGWINIAADWSRYQRRDAKPSKIVFWNTFGGAIAPVLLVIYGLLLAGTREDLRKGIDTDPIGTLASLLPDWFLLPFLIAVILTLVSGATLGIYSSGLTLLSLGVRIPRPAAAAVDGMLLTLGTVWVVFAAQNFIGPFQSFLITLGVPLSAWAGTMIGDIARRQGEYDEEAFFQKDGGRYGRADFVSLGGLAVAVTIGWGLVINNYAEEAAWNNWQGYLLEPLGLGGKTGAWAYANLGVLAALIIGFLTSYVFRAGKIRRQEGR